MQLLHTPAQSQVRLKCDSQSLLTVRIWLANLKSGVGRIVALWDSSVGHIASVLANMRLQRKQGASQNNLKVQLLHTPAQSQVRLDTFIANNGFLSSTFAQALICRALTRLSITVCSRLQDKKDAKNARGLGERDGALSPILSRNLPLHRIPYFLFSLSLFHFRAVPSIWEPDTG